MTELKTSARAPPTRAQLQARRQSLNIDVMARARDGSERQSEAHRRRSLDSREPETLAGKASSRKKKGQSWRRSIDMGIYPIEGGKLPPLSPASSNEALAESDERPTTKEETPTTYDENASTYDETPLTVAKRPVRHALELALTAALLMPGSHYELHR